MKFIILFALLPFLSIAQEVIPLWPNGAPGFESRKNEPELAKDWWVKNIHNPSITVFKAPQDKANGTAVIVCPGGGHRELVYTAEGVEAAAYLNSIGVTAIVLKYRLAREENSMYTLANTKQDVSRAMRLVRSKAVEWGINRLGIMGFSAGGEVATMIAYTGSTQPEALDPIDKLDSKPDFQILIYPGPGGIPEVIPNTAPPAFLLVANDDPCCSQPVMDLLSKYRKANLSIEAHIYAQGKHAFNMGNRSKLRTLHSWPDRLTDWLMDNGWIK
ncbi:MAG: alpha/beta hydrolase [Saprospiraceae bacterium]